MIEADVINNILAEIQAATKVNIKSTKLIKDNFQLPIVCS